MENGKGLLSMINPRKPECVKLTEPLVYKKIECHDCAGTAMSCIATLKLPMGETVTPDKFDPDVQERCAPGIHFYLNKEEAENH
jgi:hypothetical protein